MLAHAFPRQSSQCVPPHWGSLPPAHHQHHPRASHSHLFTHVCCCTCVQRRAPLGPPVHALRDGRARHHRGTAGGGQLREGELYSWPPHVALPEPVRSSFAHAGTPCLEGSGAEEQTYSYAAAQCRAAPHTDHGSGCPQSRSNASAAPASSAADTQCRPFCMPLMPGRRLPLWQGGNHPHSTWSMALEWRTGDCCAVRPRLLTFARILCLLCRSCVIPHHELRPGVYLQRPDDFTTGGPTWPSQPCTLHTYEQF